MMLTPFTYWQVIAMAQELKINLTTFFRGFISLVYNTAWHFESSLRSSLVPELKCQALVKIPLYASIICALSL